MTPPSPRLAPAPPPSSPPPAPQLSRTSPNPLHPFPLPPELIALVFFHLFHLVANDHALLRRTGRHLSLVARSWTKAGQTFLWRRVFLSTTATAASLRERLEAEPGRRFDIEEVFLLDLPEPRPWLSSLRSWRIANEARGDYWPPVPVEESEGEEARAGEGREDGDEVGDTGSEGDAEDGEGEDGGEGPATGSQPDKAQPGDDADHNAEEGEDEDETASEDSEASEGRDPYYGYMQTTGEVLSLLPRVRHLDIGEGWEPTSVLLADLLLAVPLPLLQTLVVRERNFFHVECDDYLRLLPAFPRLHRLTLDPQVELHSLPPLPTRLVCLSSVDVVPYLSAVEEASERQHLLTTRPTNAHFRDWYEDDDPDAHHQWSTGIFAFNASLAIILNPLTLTSLSILLDTRDPMLSSFLPNCTNLRHLTTHLLAITSPVPSLSSLISFLPVDLPDLQTLVYHVLWDDESTPSSFPLSLLSPLLDLPPRPHPLSLHLRDITFTPTLPANLASSFFTHIPSLPGARPVVVTRQADSPAEVVVELSWNEAVIGVDGS